MYLKNSVPRFSSGPTSLNLPATLGLHVLLPLLNRGFGGPPFTLEDSRTFMDRLGRCKLPILYSYILQMARISSHPIPAGFYHLLAYSPLSEGIHIPFSPHGEQPSKSTNKMPPILILRWWNETVINYPKDTSYGLFDQGNKESSHHGGAKCCGVKSHP